MPHRPTLDDYIAFFECEPTGVDPDIGWTGPATFDSTRGDDRILAIVDPDDGRFEFKWWNKGVLRADHALNGIVDWVLESRMGKEHLVLKFHHPSIDYFIVQLKPEIGTSCVTSW